MRGGGRVCYSRGFGLNLVVRPHTQSTRPKLIRDPIEEQNPRISWFYDVVQLCDAEEAVKKLLRIARGGE